MMYGQMTAGSWIYIGTQGIVQGTYETFAAAGKTHFGTATSRAASCSRAGLGGMGGAQPLAATMAGARVPRRRGRSDARAAPARDALPRRGRAGSRQRARAASTSASAKKQARSIARRRQRGRRLRRARAARRHARSRHRSDVARTIRSSATSRRACTLDAGGRAARDAIPRSTSRRSRASMAVQVAARCSRCRSGGVARLRLRQQPARAGRARRRAERARSRIPGFVPAYIRPLFCEGKGPFRWAALSGDPDDIRVTDEAVLDAIPDDPMLHRWIKLAQREDRVPGPAGAHLLARLRRAPPRRPALQRARAHGQGEGADRDRPRPPRLRLGRVAEPRDRGA